MLRQYHKGYSKRLGREMEALIFGHAGLPAVVFPHLLRPLLRI